MPSADEVQQARELRARFLDALWDAEAAKDPQWPAVSIRPVLDSVGAGQLPDNKVERLINNLLDDGLIEGFNMTMEAPYPLEVMLTSSGRYEVERWVEDDRPTPLIPVAHSQIFSTTTIHGNVSGSALVVGATGATVNMQTAIGEPLSNLVSAARQLFDLWDGGALEGRDEVAEDIRALEEAAAGQADGRIKPALRRIGRWAGGLVAAGTKSALSGEVGHLAETVLHQL